MINLVLIPFDRIDCEPTPLNTGHCLKVNDLEPKIVARSYVRKKPDTSWLASANSLVSVHKPERMLLCIHDLQSSQ